MTNLLPAAAIVLAAGLGTRMQPFTNDRPKALVGIAGRTLIDRALDRIRDAGVETIVVNVHHKAEMLKAHIAEWPRARPIISDETDLLRETGGGVAKALPLLGDGPFYVINSDIIWFDGALNTLQRLSARWDDSRMDALLLVHPATTATGYEGRGDFVMDPEGRLARREEQRVAPFVFTGIQILHPRLFAGGPSGVFSLNLVYDRALATGRLYGLRHDGIWMNVGTPQNAILAERVVAAL